MKNCIYCKKIADSKDHIPSKNLFVNTKGINFITVPSCKECNGSFSLDEENFRNFLVNLTTGESLTATAIFNTKVKRSVIKRPAVGYGMMKNMKLVDFIHKGIFLGKKTLIKIDENEWARHYNILDKIIKGLFFHELKYTIPEDLKIKHSWGTKEFADENDALLRGLKWNPIDGNVFAYGYGKLENSDKSVWVTCFYRRIYFLSKVS